MDTTQPIVNEPKTSDKVGLVRPTYRIDIYVGLTEGYGGLGNKRYTYDDVVACCQTYCDRVGFAVTVTPTTFVYTRGRESGVIVGLIDYPRFPMDPPVVQHHAKELAEILMDTFGQQRVTMAAMGNVEPRHNVTVMLSQPWASELVV